LTKKSTIFYPQKFCAFEGRFLCKNFVFDLFSKISHIEKRQKSLKKAHFSLVYLLRR